MPLNLARFDTFAFPPQPGDPEWYRNAETSVEFLKQLADDDEVPIHVIGPSFLISGILALQSRVTPPDKSDLLGHFIYSDDTWKIQRSQGGGEGHRIYLEPPLSARGCKSFEGGEPLFFKRPFHGADVPTEVELSQKLIHSLDVHFMPERSAYCRLNDRGDFEDVIRIVKRHSGDRDRELTIVTILAKDLSIYMALTNTVMVYRFDFTRFVPSDFNGWTDASREQRVAPDLFYNVGAGSKASFANGCMLVRPAVTVEDLVQEWKVEQDPSKREYATFKFFDSKHGRLAESSCGPGFISNYFDKNDLPWEISPAFFRAEVLHRFKADPDKFDLADRSISCRNAWYLNSYDINDAGQVHVYMIDLAQLPIDEQRYWQSFNEWPKGSISKRAYENDILGQFSTDYEPLGEIKRKIALLNKQKPAWWKPRDERTVSAARYPVTDAALEWGNEVLALDQLIVEGILPKPIKGLLTIAGIEPEPDWKSLRLLQEYATFKTGSADEATSMLEPLREMHGLRSILRGHSSSTDRKKAEQAAIRDFGSFRDHFKDLTSRCDAALDSILRLMQVDDPDRHPRA